MRLVLAGLAAILGLLLLAGLRWLIPWLKNRRDPKVPTTVVVTADTAVAVASLLVAIFFGVLQSQPSAGVSSGQTAPPTPGAAPTPTRSQSPTATSGPAAVNSVKIVALSGDPNNAQGVVVRVLISSPPAATDNLYLLVVRYKSGDVYRYKYKATLARTTGTYDIPVDLTPAVSQSWRDFGIVLADGKAAGAWVAGAQGGLVEPPAGSRSLTNWEPYQQP